MMIAAGVIALASSQANAFPRDYATFPLGIRSVGMGETGTADHAETTNTAYNPALVSMMRNTQAAWGRSDGTFGTIAMRLDGGILGAGYQWDLGRSLGVGGVSRSCPAWNWA